MEEGSLCLHNYRLVYLQLFLFSLVPTGMHLSHHNSHAGTSAHSLYSTLSYSVQLLSHKSSRSQQTRATVHSVCILMTNIIPRPLPIFMPQILLCREWNSGKCSEQPDQVKSSNDVMSLFLVFLTHDDIALGNIERRWITIGIRRVLKQHQVIFTNLHQYVTTSANWLLILHCESKKGATLIMAITLSILDRYAKFFHWCKEQ